jgi:hypothetical protein
MTYNDPNREPINPDPSRPSYPMTTRSDYTSWIIGGIVGLVLVLGIFFMMNRNDTTNTTSNTNRPAPATTGSGAAVPLPGSGQGTAGNPQQTVPPSR